MSSNWIDLLEGAGGKSEDVISIFLDIRGFTEFCKLEDDKNIATYVTKLYRKILTDYFPDITFSKPMGDGLFLVQKYEEQNAKETIITLVSSCLKLVEEFHNIIDNDIMIIFDTPNQVGIGFVRGPACCIYNGENIIDYSGKRLNHAARLMNKARPSGLIMDYASVVGILPPEIIELFNEDAICLRGVAEKHPIKILYQKSNVTIKESDRTPINEPKWELEEYEFLVKEIKRFTQSYGFILKRKPTNKESISILTKHPKYIDDELVEGTQTATTYTLSYEDYLTYSDTGVLCQLKLDLSLLRKSLEENKIPDDDIVNVVIQYY